MNGIPSRGLFWEKENHLQNAIFGWYVSSLEGRFDTLSNQRVINSSNSTFSQNISNIDPLDRGTKKTLPASKPQMSCLPTRHQLRRILGSTSSIQGTAGPIQDHRRNAGAQQTEDLLPLWREEDHAAASIIGLLRMTQFVGMNRRLCRTLRFKWNQNVLFHLLPSFWPMSKDLQLRMIFLGGPLWKAHKSEGIRYLWNTFLSFELFVAGPGFCHCSLDQKRMDNGATQGCYEKMMHHHNFSTSRFKSNGMSTPPSKSNEKQKNTVCFPCQLESVQSVFWPHLRTFRLQTSVRHTIVSAKGMQWTKKTKDYSWIAQLVYLSIAIHVSLRVILAWQSQTNSKNFKHDASAVGSCTTTTWIASPIVAAESVLIHLPKIYTELATPAIKEVSTTHAGTIPLLLVLCWARQSRAHLDLGLTALSAAALLSSNWLFDQLCLHFLLSTCSLLFMASSQVCRFRTSFTGAGLANFEHVPRSQRLCTCNSTLAIDEVAPCWSLIGVRKCCWKYKQQNRRVKRSLVHHGKSVHSWEQEQSFRVLSQDLPGTRLLSNAKGSLAPCTQNTFHTDCLLSKLPFSLRSFYTMTFLLQGYSLLGCVPPDSTILILTHMERLQLQTLLVTLRTKHWLLSHIMISLRSRHSFGCWDVVELCQQQGTNGAWDSHSLQRQTAEVATGEEK